MSKRAATATWIAGVCVTAGLVGGCAPAGSSPTSSTPGPTASPSAFAPDAALSGPPSVSPAAATTAADAVRVVSVIDGDTIVVSGGRHVRVLGIDSCEAATPGGRRATAAARARLGGAAVRLTAEPGVDLDRYGRELRYVATDAGDFGEYMVAADHTAVYQGHNDASPARLAALRALDGNGRVCGAPEAAGASNPAPAPKPAPKPAPRPAPKPVPRPAPRPVAPAPAPAPAAYYKNCDAARAAGVAPLHVGQPGYSAKLDRDGDGIACE